MFNFLNSAVLVAAVAALIPLLIHLFSKRRVRVVEFSSLRHLKEMQKRQVRRIKIRQILLLILRMLIVLVAVLAFARPASKGGYVGSHASVSAVILMDRSASMQRQVKDGQLFDLAKKSAADILGNFGQSDELVLIPFDRQTYFPAGERFFSRDVAEDVLSEATAGYEEGNFGDAFNKAVRLLSEAKNLNKELYVITDRQASSLPETVDSITENTTVYFVDVPVETDGNCGVVNVDLGGQLIEVGTGFNVKAEIQNYDNLAKSELLASLFVDGIRVMQAEFATEEKGKQVVQLRSTVYQPGFHYGWVEISDDGFPADNRFYFSFTIPEKFNILIVDGDNSGELVKLALIPSEKLARYWSVKTSRPDQLATSKLGEYDAVVLCGLSTLGSVETSRLLKYVDDGDGIFIIAGAGINPQYFNANFGGILDFQFVTPTPMSFSGAGYYTLERFDYTHPVLMAFSGFQQDSLPTLRFYSLPAVRDGRGNRDLAYFSSGAPAIVESGYGLGKVILLTTPIVPRYSDISSHSFFVPFVIRTMEYLAGDISEYLLKNYVGENVIRALPGREVRYGSVELITPENRSYNIAGTEKLGLAIYDCRPIEMPGIYQLKNNGRLVDLFPVNLPVSESDLSTAGFDRFEKALKTKQFRTIPYDRSSASLISEARFGRELWKLFLWAALIIMAVEMLLSREKETEPDKK
ncbi:MAG: BatA domain-containing protein [Candidatus Zixiibacteriota bacterium]|nr:MAG: BatA domain-containing protein [candidate division Zixibacteria bacterium]